MLTTLVETASTSKDIERPPDTHRTGVADG
jgi:hypothetical protein